MPRDSESRPETEIVLSAGPWLPSMREKSWRSLVARLDGEEEAGFPDGRARRWRGRLSFPGGQVFPGEHRGCSREDETAVRF